MKFYGILDFFYLGNILKYYYIIEYNISYFFYLIWNFINLFILVMGVYVLNLKVFNLRKVLSI